MAELTHCPTCQSPVSTEALSCPRCGQPLGQQDDRPESMRASAKIPLPPKRPRRGGFCGCLVLLATVGLMMGSIYLILHSVAPSPPGTKTTIPERFRSPEVPANDNSTVNPRDNVKKDDGPATGDR